MDSPGTSVINSSTEKIDQLFGRILDEPLNDDEPPLLEPPPSLLPEQLLIGNERAFESLLIAHTSHIINRALIVSVQIYGRQKKLQPHQPFLMFSGGHCKPVNNLLPDWGVVQRTPSPIPFLESLVLGETKYESEDPTEIPLDELNAQLSGNSKTIQSWIQQIFNYAVKHETRYCFITPLRVFRCRRIEDEKQDDGSTTPRVRGGSRHDPAANPVSYDEASQSSEEDASNTPSPKGGDRHDPATSPMRHGQESQDSEEMGNNTPPPSSQVTSTFHPSPSGTSHNACLQICTVNWTKYPDTNKHKDEDRGQGRAKKRRKRNDSNEDMDSIIARWAFFMAVLLEKLRLGLVKQLCPWPGPMSR
ncbi:hypothetical protein BKA61DRAFT_672573 [Leptodontidium sp. MPI-SDFR-AT-0119]|nr:hypothetical protein BKA61DRAFT_672573 [Leptodontidium sp. MPI-SDFR-AT-0119]